MMSKDLFQDGGPIKTNTRTFFSHGQFFNSNGISVRVWVEAFQKGQLFENPLTNDVFQPLYCHITESYKGIIQMQKSQSIVQYMRHGPPALDGIPSLHSDGEALPEVACLSCVTSSLMIVKRRPSSETNC